MQNQSIDQALRDIKAINLIGAVGHHSFFLTNHPAKNRIRIHVSRILAFGLKQYLNEEYLSTIENEKLGKSFIVNEIEDQYFLLDGNLHMLSIILALPTTTLGDIMQTAERSDIIRFWKNGYENSPNIQKNPYDTYIPLDICTEKIAGAHKGVDHFKNPPEDILIIPSNIPYNSMLFLSQHRGQPLGVTATALLDQYSAQFKNVVRSLSFYRRENTLDEKGSCSFAQYTISEETVKKHVSDFNPEIDMIPYYTYTGLKPDDDELKKYQLTVTAKAYINEGNYLAGAKAFDAIAAICKNQGKISDAYLCEEQAFNYRQQHFLNKANIQLDVFTSLPIVEILQAALTELAEKAENEKNYYENIFYLKLNSALCKAQEKERDAYLLDTTIYANKKLIDSKNTTSENVLYERLYTTYNRLAKQ